MAMRALSDNLRGALFIVLSMACFVTNDGIMKSFADELAWYQAIALRGGFAAVLCVALAFAIDRRRPVSEVVGYLRHRSCALRILFEIAATVLYLLALFNMPLADATAVNQMLPVLLMLGGAVFFRETIGWHRMVAAGAGFFGVMLIVQPGTAAFSPVALIAFSATLCMTARDLVTKGLPAKIPSSYVTVLTIVSVWVLGLVLSVGSTWPPIDWGMLVRVLAAAVLVTLAFLFAIMAVRVGEMSFMAPFRYSALIWGLLIGFLAFDELPGPLPLLGAAIVVAAGLYSMHRQRRLDARLTVSGNPGP